MRFIKKFEKFLEGAVEPQVDPGKTKVKPGKPEVKPGRPSPIPGKNPSPVPLPAKASADEAAERFIDLMVQNNEDVKKYAKII